MGIIAKVDEITGEIVCFTRGLGIAPGVGDVVGETHILAGSTQTFLYVQNHRGDTVALVDQSGNVVGTYAHDAWGNITSHTGADAYFTFSSKHYDENAGLYYYGYRWYDPVSKRWTQPDPEGLSEGLDLYQFCGNDPINNVDAYGMSICAADLGRAWLGLLAQAKNLATLDTGVGWIDTAVNTVTHSYIDLAGGKPIAGVLCLGENWYDRYHNNVCQLGNNQWWAVADTANLALGDFLGYTALLEGSYGLDRATLEMLSKEERWLRGVNGGLQLGMSIVAGAEMLHNLSPVGIRETGANAEQSAIRMLERKAYSELQPLKNSSGHGIDIVGKNSAGEWRFFEVKGHASQGMPGLSAAQQDITSFVQSRLSRAASGRGGYSPATTRLAESIRSEIVGTKIQGMVINVKQANSWFPRVSITRW